jgi:purine-binding chemotaxis protein CheW
MDECTTTLDDILARKRQSGGEVVNVDEPAVKLVFFSLGEQWYAFYGQAIREVLADREVYYLPGCPPSMEGVINVRGDIESVIRLRTVLGLPEVKAAASSRILLGKAGAMCSGIRVDCVEEVLDVLQSAIQSPPHTLPEHLRPIVLGIVMYGDHPVHLLDLERIFTDYRAGLR